jgi:hypothetical protein
MLSRFFIDRPIFATVLSIVITLAGGLAVFSLPIAQYPPISPPQVQVAINYPGASAQVVADTSGGRGAGNGPGDGRGDGPGSAPGAARHRRRSSRKKTA